MRGHQTKDLAKALPLTTPGCPRCISSEILFCKELGMITRNPQVRQPCSTQTSRLVFENTVLIRHPRHVSANHIEQISLASIIKDLSASHLQSGIRYELKQRHGFQGIFFCRYR
eukprot:Pompholyxophrys_punicea_v1_NODE_512_length_1796_cov_6.566341.p3 type:complete len:114 gc:universal NODE_512_length_1796_cov_6.566341:1388-1729(+)